MTWHHFLAVLCFADVRLLAAPFLHASDMHLYYNMSSLLWKGRQLERAGWRSARQFAFVMAVWVLFGSALFVALEVWR